MADIGTALAASGITAAASVGVVLLNSWLQRGLERGKDERGLRDARRERIESAYSRLIAGVAEELDRARQVHYSVTGDIPGYPPIDVGAELTRLSRESFAFTARRRASILIQTSASDPVLAALQEYLGALSSYLSDIGVYSMQLRLGGPDFP